jgi:hypothetical protein
MQRGAASAAGPGHDGGAADYGMIDAQLVDQGGVAARGAALQVICMPVALPSFHFASAAGAGRDDGAADYGLIDAQLVDQGGVAARGAAPAGDLHAGSTSVVPLRRRAPGAAALLDAGWCWPAPPALAAITALLTTA